MAFTSKPVVQFEQDDHPALARNLERDLQQAHDNEVAGLTAARDWADFQKRNGRIDGLNIALGLCQTARKKLEA
jgi:hypothetical protein